MQDSFSVRRTLSVNGKNYSYLSLPSLSEQIDISRLPFSLKILLENLLRHEDGVDITRGDIEALAGWDPKAKPETEIAFTPSRVVLQDFTGVPAVGFFKRMPMPAAWPAKRRRAPSPSGRGIPSHVTAVAGQFFVPVNQKVPNVQVLVRRKAVSTLEEETLWNTWGSDPMLASTVLFVYW